MDQFLFIITNIILPVFIIISVGFIVQKKFKLHIGTLSKVQMYVLLPALVFHKIYVSTLSLNVVTKVSIYTVILFIILMFLCMSIARLSHWPKAKEKAFINSIVLRNIGNYGIPLISLLYATTDSSYALSIHMVVVIVQTILMYTIGLYNASSGKYTGKQALMSIGKIPIMYVILIAAGLRGFSIHMPNAILSPIVYLSQGVVPLALLALGAQLAETKFALGDISVHIGNAMRLVVSPAIAMALCKIMHMDLISTQVLVIGAATPTAINSLLLAIEFDGDRDYTSQIIFLSTLFSALVLPGIIYLIY